MTSQETTLCSTRYPIMLVHGVGARDSLEQCYWRRIPDYLRQRGAVVEFGFQDSWATVEQNAAMLATRGWSNQEIADHMGISLNTVKQYISMALKKLHLKQRKDLKQHMLR